MVENNSNDKNIGQEIKETFEEFVERANKRAAAHPDARITLPNPNAKKCDGKILHKKTYQSNVLIENKRKFTNREAKLFYLALAEITPKLKDDFTGYTKELVFTWSPNELVKAFGNQHKIRSLMKDICKSLVTKTIFLIEDDDTWEYIHLFELVTWSDKTGLTMAFDKRMRKYLVDLVDKNYYTKIYLTTIFSLTSSYAIRILELMLKVSNQKHKKRDFEYMELRDKLGVPDNKHLRFSNFKARVLKIPTDEINKNTGYFIEYDTTPFENTYIISFTLSGKVKIDKDSTSDNVDNDKQEKSIANVIINLQKLDSLSADADTKRNLLNTIIKKYGGDIVKKAQARLRQQEKKRASADMPKE